MSPETKNMAALGCDQSESFYRIVCSTIALLLTFLTASVAAQEAGVSKHSKATASSFSGQDWYHPVPASPNVNATFALAPVTVERPVVSVPPAVRSLAIFKLSDVETVKLTRADCTTLTVPFEPDRLLDQKIQAKTTNITQGLRYMKLHPLNGSPYDATYRSIQHGIAEQKAQIAHWKSLKGRVRPYLVRAVAANYVSQDFDAGFWRGSVTVVHSSMVDNSANDPLRQYASIGDIKPADLVKWPVVVYLEAPPAHVFTRISVLKLGR